MRAVVQRVTGARVTVAGSIAGQIGVGLVVLLGVARDDEDRAAIYLADKTVNLRVFQDEQGKMNRSILDIEGQMLVVSQFTLYGDVRRGRRPSYTEAAEPDKANRLYEYFVERVRSFGLKVETGVFQAMMEVS
ncbi:MAG TPA: D-aminoacyl-tRNA deacylase, partial [Blastocatellia bacterium]|nr:D-aminoacyl-tRNA deacylase [Blastocatellia bacterium]